MQGVPSRHAPGLVAIVTGDLTRYASSMQCLMALQTPAGSPYHWRPSVLVADSINHAFATFMAMPELEWCWLMGDDHQHGPDLLLKLLDRDVDCIIPLCLNRVPPFAPTIVEHRHETPRLKHIEDLPASGLYELAESETCGDAGMLVRRRVLEAIERPWYDKRRSGSFAAEDQAFTRRVQEAGFKVHVDLDCPIGHTTPAVFAPAKVNGKWAIGITVGGKPVVAINPVRA